MARVKLNKWIMRKIMLIVVVFLLCGISTVAAASPDFRTGDAGMPGKNVKAAPTVDEFVDVPWGATAGQIDAVMRDKGFCLREDRSTKDIRVYGGIFGGYNATLQFHLLKGVFYMGEVKLEDDTQVQDRWRSLDNMFTEKYGHPKLGGSKSEPAHIWDGLKGVVAWDDVEISMAEHFLRKQPRIVFCNKSLEARLQTESASTVTGFLGIPWGATAEQIDKAMAERGFSFMEKDRGGDVEIRKYQGTFAGYACVIHFSLKANAFFLGRAEDLCRTEGTGGNEEIVKNAGRVEKMISAIYGLPQPDQKPRDSFYYVNWNDLPSAAGTDKVGIGMLVKMAVDDITKGMFFVDYINYSLRDRL